jgi:hypothetical protein
MARLRGRLDVPLEIAQRALLMIRVRLGDHRSVIMRCRGKMSFTRWRLVDMRH